MNMKHFGTLASALLAFYFVASAQTTVTDTIKTPVSQTNFAGTVQIIGPAITYDGVTYAKAARRIRVTNGAFSLVLVPNVGASPSGTSYAVRFTADEGISWDETWVVVASGSPVTIGSIRSTVPAPSTTIAFSQLPTCGEAEIIKFTSGAWACSATGAGTVSSIALALPSELTVSGSPVTTAGTITAAWASQTANKILGSPDGSSGTPSFRALVAADIPTLDAAKIGTGVLAIGRLASGTPDGTKFVRDDGTLAVPPGGITLASLSATSPLAYNNGTGVFSIPAAATGGVSGYLSGTDWGTFNGKENALTFSAPLDRSTNTISCLVASGSQAGCLSSTDWTTFNGKAAASHTHAASDINSGTLAIAQGGTGAATTSQNFAFIGPTSGSGAPSFRALEAGDIPSLDASKITAGTLGVARGGTGLTGGTSGGIPYYSDASTLASSGALTANLPVIGGGAGAAPTVGTVQGNTTKFTTYAGSAPSTDDCAKFDVNGNITTAGAACGSGGGGGSNGALVLLKELTASASATLDFSTRTDSSALIQSDFDDYIIRFSGIKPATTNTLLQMRMSTDGGANYDTSSVYSWANWWWRAGATVTAGTSAQTAISINGFGASTSANWPGIDGEISLKAPGSAFFKQITGKIMLFENSSNRIGVELIGAYESTTAVDAFQFLFSSGNIASGTIRVYGVAKTGSPGGGDVTGPASATDNNLVTMDGITGKLIQDSGKAIPAGDVVGTSDSQTLTAKTLTTPIVTAYTVAGLPAAGTAGRVAVVTDASTAGSCTSGGGSAVAFCRDSGAAWVPLGDGGGGGGTVDLATGVTGTLPVGNGGTGATTFTANGVLYGNGTSAIAATGTGTSGQILTSNGSGSAPTFQTQTKSASETRYVLSSGLGPDFSSLGTGYTNPTFGVNTNPTRNEMVMEPTAGTPWGFLVVFRLPSSWLSTGTTSITIGSYSGTTINDRTWSVETSCLGPGDTANGTPSWSAAQTVTFTPSANNWSSTSLTLDSTSLASCSAGELAYFRVTRTDALSGSQRIRAVSLAWQESLN